MLRTNEATGSTGRLPSFKMRADGINCKKDLIVKYSLFHLTNTCRFSMGMLYQNIPFLPKILIHSPAET